MRNEIRPLEQAVCGLVTKLDILLTAEFGLRLLDVGHGLHISTPDHLSEHRDDAFVTIHPVGWPKESHISARFFWTSKGWELYEGGLIEASHLALPTTNLRFFPYEKGMGVRFGPMMTPYEAYHLRQAYAQLIASLQEDAAEHAE